MDVWGALWWIGLGAAIIGFGVIVLIVRRPSAPDLGSVSSQSAAGSAVTVAASIFAACSFEPTLDCV
jgi:hypothetical protein